jgi:hypothetical protein
MSISTQVGDGGRADATTGGFHGLSPGYHWGMRTIMPIHYWMKLD